MLGKIAARTVPGRCSLHRGTGLRPCRSCTAVPAYLPLRHRWRGSLSARKSCLFGTRPKCLRWHSRRGTCSLTTEVRNPRPMDTGATFPTTAIAAQIQALLALAALHSELPMLVAMDDLERLERRRQGAQRALTSQNRHAYEQLSGSRVRPIIVPVLDSRCGGCGVEVLAMYLGKIATGTDLLRCQGCGRFLYSPAWLANVAERAGDSHSQT